MYELTCVSQSCDWDSVFFQGPEGAHVEAMARIPCQVLLPAVPADCRVRLGLAGGSLLDITLPYHQRHAAVCSGVVLFLEDLVQKWAKVSAFLWEMVGITGVVKRHQWWRSPLKCFSDLESGVILCWREMAQQFLLLERIGDQSLAPTSGIYNCLPFQLQGIWHPLPASEGTAFMYRNPYIYT